MGGPYKGAQRSHSLSSMRQSVSSISGSSLKGGSEAMAVMLLSLLLPGLGPVIWAAYTAIKTLRVVLDGLRDYEKLKSTMSEKRAAAVAAARVVTKEGIRHATAGVIDQSTQDVISNGVNTIVRSEPVTNAVNSVFSSEADRENMKYMLDATLTQFIHGAIEESEDKIIDGLVKEVIK